MVWGRANLLGVYDAICRRRQCKQVTSAASFSSTMPATAGIYGGGFDRRRSLRCCLWRGAVCRRALVPVPAFVASYQSEPRPQRPDHRGPAVLRSSEFRARGRCCCLQAAICSRPSRPWSTPLTFPRPFAPGGRLGAGPQPRLALHGLAWRIPLLVLGYAALKAHDNGTRNVGLARERDRGKHCGGDRGDGRIHRCLSPVAMTFWPILLKNGHYTHTPVMLAWCRPYGVSASRRWPCSGSQAAFRPRHRADGRALRLVVR